MDPLKALPPPTPLTADQQAALKKLHAAATQLEGVFVGMLYKEMQSTVPKDGILGKQSNAESMWQDMLADKQSDAIAQSGSFGIAKMIEKQLRAQVLAGTSTVPNLPASLTTPQLPPGMTAPPSISSPTDELDK
jgi:Rod binding domain-containing protein